MQGTWTKPIASLARWRQRAPRYLIGGAWFFIAFTLAHLAWVIGTKWSNPAGLTALYQTTVATAAGDQTHRAFGLAYDGVPGLLLALLQAGVVAAAAFMSTRSNAGRRRIGHAILLAWAGLWMGDLLHLAAIDQRLDSMAQASLLMGLFACTVYRAVSSGHRRGDRAAPPPPIDEPVDEAPGEPMSEPDDLLAIAPAAPSRLERVKAVSARAIDGGRRAAVRVQERGRPIAAAAAKRLRRFGPWLRSKGVLPAAERAVTRAVDRG